MTVGGVLDQAFGLYTKFFWRFVGVTAVVVLGLDLIQALVIAGGTTWIGLLLTGVITFVGTFWVQGALTLAVDDVRDGRVDTSIGDLYARTQPVLGRLIGAGLLAGIGIGIGFILFIVPGLYLLARWAVIVPAVVLEGKSVGESFTRSTELTDGHRWAVLGVAVLTGLAGAVVNGVVSSVVGAIVPGDFFGYWLGNVVASCITTPFIALALTVAYFQLRGSPEAEQPAAAAV